MRRTIVDDQISRIVSLMGDQDVTSKEYSEMLNRLEKLQKIRNEEKPRKISSDAILSTAGNLLGILLIIRHEHVNVITSRAFNMISRSS